MAVFKVKKGDTYESIAKRSGVSAGAVMRYFKGRPLYKGMTYNDKKLQGMVQGGQAYAALSPDINPWGLGVGEIPDSAWETEAGIDIAENYLTAIGMTGFGTGEGVTTEEGVTTTSERPPAAEAPQALTGTEQLTPGAGVTTTSERPPAAEAPQAQMPGSEQLPVTPATTPTTTRRGRRTEAVPYEAGVISPTVPTIGGLEEAYQIAAEWAMGTMLPEGYDPSFSAQPPGEVSGTTPGGSVYDPETGQRYRTPTTAAQTAYTPGVGIAAYEFYQAAVKEGVAPTSVSPEAVDLIGFSDELMEAALYEFNEETGMWELDMSGVAEEGGGEGTAGGGSGPSYGGGYGGYGRYRRRGGRRSSYGNTFNNGQVNTQFNWRIGWR